MIIILGKPDGDGLCIKLWITSRLFLMLILQVIADINHCNKERTENSMNITNINQWITKVIAYQHNIQFIRFYLIRYTVSVAGIDVILANFEC